MSISGKEDPVVRPIAAADIAEALGQGLRDFQASRAQIRLWQSGSIQEIGEYVASLLEEQAS